MFANKQTHVFGFNKKIILNLTSHRPPHWTHESTIRNFGTLKLDGIHSTYKQLKHAFLIYT